MIIHWEKIKNKTTYFWIDALMINGEDVKRLAEYKGIKKAH